MATKYPYHRMVRLSAEAHRRITKEAEAWRETLPSTSEAEIIREAISLGLDALSRRRPKDKTHD